MRNCFIRQYRRLSTGTPLISKVELLESGQSSYVKVHWKGKRESSTFLDFWLLDNALEFRDSITTQKLTSAPELFRSSQLGEDTSLIESVQHADDGSIRVEWSIPHPDVNNGNRR